MEVYRDLLEENVKLRIALRNIYDAMVDAVVEANGVIDKDDKMARRLDVKPQISADF